MGGFHVPYEVQRPGRGRVSNTCPLLPGGTSDKDSRKKETPRRTHDLAAEVEATTGQSHALPAPLALSSTLGGPGRGSGSRSVSLGISELFSKTRKGSSGHPVIRVFVFQLAVFRLWYVFLFNSGWKKKIVCEKIGLWGAWCVCWAQYAGANTPWWTQAKTFSKEKSSFHSVYTEVDSVNRSKQRFSVSQTFPPYYKGGEDVSLWLKGSELTKHQWV